MTRGSRVLLLLMASVSSALAQEGPTVIETSGSGEVSLPPDHATLVVGIRVLEGSPEEAAEVIAAAEGGTLGRLLEITTVGGSEARQYGGIEMQTPPSISAVVLAPGAVTVRASVVVRWELVGNRP